MSYWTTPLDTTGIPPCDLFPELRIRTRLDLLKPDLAKNIYHKQAVQKTHHNLHAKVQGLDVGQQVMACNFEEGLKWFPESTSQQHGPVTLEVKLEDGRLWKCYTDRLKLQEQNHSIEPDGEVDYDPDIPLSLEEDSRTHILYLNHHWLSLLQWITLTWCLHQERLFLFI